MAPLPTPPISEKVEMLLKMQIREEKKMFFTFALAFISLKSV